MPARFGNLDCLALYEERQWTVKFIRHIRDTLGIHVCDSLLSRFDSSGSIVHPEVTSQIEALTENCPPIWDKQLRIEALSALLLRQQRALSLRNRVDHMSRKLMAVLNREWAAGDTAEDHVARLEILVNDVVMRFRTANAQIRPENTADMLLKLGTEAVNCRYVKPKGNCRNSHKRGLK